MTNEFAEEILNNIFGINRIVNPESSPFLFGDKGLNKRLNHNKARVGQKIFDGNNGDRWLVLATDHRHHRMIVENKDQDFVSIWWWDNE